MTDKLGDFMKITIFQILVLIDLRLLIARRHKYGVLGTGTWLRTWHSYQVLLRVGLHTSRWQRPEVMKVQLVLLTVIRELDILIARTLREHCPLPRRSRLNSLITVQVCPKSQNCPTRVPHVSCAISVIRALG